MPLERPELSEEEINRIQYVSLADYVRRMDSLKTFEAKMAFTTRYLLLHGGRDDRDFPLTDFLHVAQMKIADASVKLRKQFIHLNDDDVNPDAKALGQDGKNQLFMGRPGDYLLREAQAKREELAARGNNLSPDEAVLLNSCNTLLEYDPMILNESVDKIEKHNARDVEARLLGKYGSERALEKAYEKTKPGVLSKMFGTSSKAYANLEEVYQAFNNENHALYGNLEALGKAAVEYVQHRFPGWDPKTGVLPGPEAIGRLKGTAKARTEFSLSIIRAVAEQKAVETDMDKLRGACLDKATDLINDNPPQAQEAQEEFQNAINEDLAQPEEEFDQAQAQADYAKVFAPIEENEVEDEGVEP